MSSFCTAKATHIFSAKKIQHICVALDVNFNESLTNDVVSFEQLGPDFLTGKQFSKDVLFRNWRYKKKKKNKKKKKKKKH